MRCVVLQYSDGAHLGFMLLSADLTEPSGTCVFMAMPGQAAQLDSAEAEELMWRREAGESVWNAAGHEPRCLVVRTPGLATDLFIELGSPGRWGTGSGPDRKVLGLVVLPPGK